MGQVLKKWPAKFIFKALEAKGLCDRCLRVSFQESSGKGIVREEGDDAKSKQPQIGKLEFADKELYFLSRLTVFRWKFRRS